MWQQRPFNFLHRCRVPFRRRPMELCGRRDIGERADRAATITDAPAERSVARGFHQWAIAGVGREMNDREAGNWPAEPEADEDEQEWWRRASRISTIGIFVLLLGAFLFFART